MSAPQRTGNEEADDVGLLKAVAQIIEANFLPTFGIDRLNAVKRAADSLRRNRPPSDL